MFEHMLYHLGVSESWVVKENNTYLFSAISQNLFSDIPQIRKAILGTPKQKPAEKFPMSLK